MQVEGRAILYQQKSTKNIAARIIERCTNMHDPRNILIVCTIYYHIKKNIYVCTLGKENVNCGLSLHLHSAVINQKA